MMIQMQMIHRLIVQLHFFLDGSNTGSSYSPRITFSNLAIVVAVASLPSGTESLRFKTWAEQFFSIKFIHC